MVKTKQDLIAEVQGLHDLCSRKRDESERLLKENNDLITANKQLNGRVNELENTIHFLAGMLVDKGVRVDRWTGKLSVNIELPENNNIFNS